MFVQRLHRLFTTDIWRACVLEDLSWRGRLFRFFRVLILCGEGVFRNNLFARAGSLSFSSLVGLAPLVAITIPIAALLLGQDEDRAVRWLSKVVTYVAPHMAKYEQVQPRKASDKPAAEGEAPAAVLPETDLNPQLVEMLNGIIRTARSGTLGVIGAFALIVVVIQLFTAVETAFNDIWGARRGRTWMTRIVIYWTVLTLGSLIALAALSLVSLAATARLEWLPFGMEARSVIEWSAAPAAGLLLLGVLIIFYKTTPATPVRWSAAIAGALVVSILLLINHYSASLYVGRVMMEKNFYGQLGIIFVLMAGLYVFWLFILIGAQLAYAVQHANYLCRDPDWDRLSHRTRESYALLVFLQIARRFNKAEPPPSVLELARRLRLPNTVVHQCLLQLQALGFVTFVEADDASEVQTRTAQVARPLDSIGLQDFRNGFENLGVGREDSSLYDMDPLLRAYRELPHAPTDAPTATLGTLLSSEPTRSHSGRLARP